MTEPEIQQAIGDGERAIAALRCFRADDREGVRDAVEGLSALPLLAVAETALIEVARARGVTWEQAVDALALSFMEIGLSDQTNDAEEDQ